MTGLEFWDQGETPLQGEFETPSSAVQEQTGRHRCKCEQLLLPNGVLLDMNTDEERTHALNIAKAIGYETAVQEPYRIG